MIEEYDIVIIGTGMGGGTMARALSSTGASILLIERGDFLPREPQNWDPSAVLSDGRYRDSSEEWLTGDGIAFPSNGHYFVGGMTKVYSGVLARLREQDFGEIDYQDGLSPGWPIQYDDLEPYYMRAEDVYQVHGAVGEDPTEPPHALPYAYPAIPHEPYIEELTDRFETKGLHPYHLPLGIDNQHGGRCVRCRTCEQYPCMVHAKSDAEVQCVRPALASPNVKLMTRAFARRLLTDPTGSRITAVEVERDSDLVRVFGSLFILSCGTIHSPALLLRSANSRHPNGLANSSGLVGQNLMQKNVTVAVAIDLRRENRTMFQKTWGINDFYLGVEGSRGPLGSIQALGKYDALVFSPHIKDEKQRLQLASHSTEMAVMSETLPDRDNRVVVTPDLRLQVFFRRNNLAGHVELVDRMKEYLRGAGYPIVSVPASPGAGSGAWERISPCAHISGTLRFGEDPHTSVLDPFCRAHDVENLFVVDASFFPSQGAINPALTIAANALRVADHIKSAALPGLTVEAAAGSS
jgi:choline dehydrogenase-like flavoprotein